MNRLRRLWARVAVIAAAFAIAAAGPVTEEEWDAACRRAGWRPGGDEEAGT